MKTKQDQATARAHRFCIMSPSGAAQFLAKDEADADNISKRLASIGLKHEILPIDKASDRDVHGVNALRILFRQREAANIPKKVKLIRISEAEHAALLAVAEAAKLLLGQVEGIKSKGGVHVSSLAADITIAREALANLAARGE